MDYIPTKDVDLAAFALNFVEYSENNAARFKFDPQELAELRRLAEDFTAKLNIAKSPSHTASDIIAKNTVRAALDKALRYFVQGQVNHNRAVMSVDRVGMGLPPKDYSRAPSEGMSHRVTATLSSAPRQVIVHFRDQGSLRRGKPEGIHGCELRRAFLDKPPESIDELTLSEFATATPFVFNFDESQRGKHLFMALRWETSRNEKEPWSPIYDIFVP